MNLRVLPTARSARWLAVQRRRCWGMSNEGSGRALNCSLANIYYSLTFGSSYRISDSFFLSLFLGILGPADVF